MPNLGEVTASSFNFPWSPRTLLKSKFDHFDSFNSLGTDKFLSDSLNTIKLNCSYFVYSILALCLMLISLSSTLIFVTYPIILISLPCNVYILIILMQWIFLKQNLLKTLTTSSHSLTTMHSSLTILLTAWASPSILIIDFAPVEKLIYLSKILLSPFLLVSINNPILLIGQSYRRPKSNFSHFLEKFQLIIETVSQEKISLPRLQRVQDKT